VVREYVHLNPVHLVHKRKVAAYRSKLDRKPYRIPDFCSSLVFMHPKRNRFLISDIDV
jgi:hypothetical protein